MNINNKDNLDLSKDRNNYSSNLLNNLKYDFESVDYIFIDLNKFLSYEDINLNNLYDYISSKIANVYNNTSIIMIFPNLDKTDPNLIQVLIDISSISDIVIYDKRDAMTLCSHLGYKVEDKNFEVRFMFLKEFRRTKEKRQKTCLFLEDFNKLTVVMQETDTNLIIYHNDFNFEIGFKLDYFRTVTNNNEFLKFVFYGGFFSRVVQNQPFDVAFSVGLETFKKMLEILHNNLPLPDSPDYFLVQQKVSKGKNPNVKAATTSNFNKNRNKKVIQDRENKFVLDAVSMSNNKLKDSLYIKEIINPKKNAALPYSNPIEEKKPATQTQFFGGKSPNQSAYKVLEIEQKKLMSILEANEKIQQKLNKLLSMSPGGKAFLNSDNEDDGSKNYQKKNYLPKLKANNEMRMAQTSSDNITKKKNLKPISKETYDRLTGANKTNYAAEFKSPIQQQQLAQYNDFVNASILNENSPKQINPNIYQPSPIDNNKKGDLNVQQSSNVVVIPDKNSQLTQLMSEQVKKVPPKPKLIRVNKQLDPVCNLGFIPKPPETIKVEDKKKNEFRDYTFFDNKFKKNKGLDRLFGDKDKKVAEIIELNKSDNERGKKEDYNDLNRSIEKKRKREEEIEKKKNEEKRKQEEKLAEERKAAERKQQEEELKLIKEKEEKAEEKKEEKKKEDGKKSDVKKDDVKKDEVKK